VNKRLAVISAFIAFVCCLIFNDGCTQKKLSDVNARPSPAWVKNAVIYEVNLRSFSKGDAWKSLEPCMPELKSLGITVISLPPIHPIGELTRNSGKPGCSKRLL
jgi:pullulanase/glycogen debranching enzyme